MGKAVEVGKAAGQSVVTNLPKNKVTFFSKKKYDFTNENISNRPPSVPARQPHNQRQRQQADAHKAISLYTSHSAAVSKFRQQR